jgi:hypothetical protein
MGSNWLRQSDSFAFAEQTQILGALPPLGLRPIHPRDISETKKKQVSVQ